VNTTFTPNANESTRNTNCWSKCHGPLRHERKTGYTQLKENDLSHARDEFLPLFEILSKPPEFPELTQAALLSLTQPDNTNQDFAQLQCAL
jgi:hypothetical protein